MNPDDLKKKDLQLLTAYAQLKSLALLKNIHDNQAFIISELTKLPIKDVFSKLHTNLDEDYLTIIDEFVKNIPDYKK